MQNLEKFLGHTLELVEKEFKSLNLSEIEKTSKRIQISHIFENKVDPEEAYYELLDYLEDDEHLQPLMQDIEMYYLTSIK